MFGNTAGRSKGRLFLSVLLLMMLSVGSLCWAGDAVFDTSKSPHELELTVMLDAREDIDNWKPHFNDLNTMLFRATNGNARLSKVTFYQTPEGKEKADFVISQVISGGYTYAYKGAGGATGIGKDGAGGRIYLNNTKRAPVMLHEMGHWMFGIYDHYIGILRNPADNTKVVDRDLVIRTIVPTAAGVLNTNNFYSYRWNPNSLGGVWKGFNLLTGIYMNHPKFSPERAASSTSIMDGPMPGDEFFTTPVDAATTFVTEHLSVYSVTAPTTPAWPLATVEVVTQQNNLNSLESDWETIHRYWPTLPIPTVDLKTNPPAGAPPAVDYVEIPAQVDFSICIDRSGSMGGTPIVLARRAAQIAISLTRTSGKTATVSDLNGSDYDLEVAGDRFSLTSFSDTVSVNFSGPDGKVVDMTPANRASAFAAVSGINATGLTSIGGGLQASYGTMILDEDAPKSIILLSDGNENASPMINTVLPSIIAAGIKVHAIGLGTGLDRARLQSVASQTGGEAFFTNSAAQLPFLFVGLYSRIRGESIVAIFSDLISGGRSAAAPANLTIDQFVGQATFVATWDTNDLLELELTAPDGTKYSTSDPGAAEFESQPGYLFLRITEPPAGQWQAVLSGPNLVAGHAPISYAIQVLAIDSTVTFNAKADKLEYNYPEPVLLRASSAAPMPVMNADVSARIKRPDGTTVSVPLRDDGTGGDEVAGDGIYSTTFSSFSGDGAYSAVFRFDSTGGEFPTAENAPGIEIDNIDFTANPVRVETQIVAAPPVYTRETTQDFLVNNAPVTGVSAMDAGSQNIDISWTVPRAGDTVIFGVALYDFGTGEEQFLPLGGGSDPWKIIGGGETGTTVQVANGGYYAVFLAQFLNDQTSVLYDPVLVLVDGPGLTVTPPPSPFVESIDPGSFHVMWGQQRGLALSAVLVYDAQAGAYLQDSSYSQGVYRVFSRNQTHGEYTGLARGWYAVRIYHLGWNGSVADSQQAGIDAGDPSGWLWVWVD